MNSENNVFFTARSIVQLILIQDTQTAEELNILGEIIAPTLIKARDNNRYDISKLEDVLLQVEQAYYEYLEGWTTITDTNEQTRISDHYNNIETILSRETEEVLISDSVSELLLHNENINIVKEVYLKNKEIIKTNLVSASMLFDFNIKELQNALPRYKKPTLQIIK